MRKSRHGLSPPPWLANDPRPAALACITKLRENAPGKHGKDRRERAPHQSAPELVAPVTMMNAELITGATSVMMSDRDDRRERHAICISRTVPRVNRCRV